MIRAPRATGALDAAAAEPLSGDEFARAMARLAPFEPQPHLAVALSGGGDSMALTLLADDWARACGGRITALTVDHGLRPEAAAEAAQAGDWCAAHGIAHVVLRRKGPAPRSGIQAAARAARYALLEEWCRAHHVLHLLVAHQREDQAETVLMRFMRGSGAVGLAGMASIVERRWVRLLRPLLGVPRARLRAMLTARGQGWIEDPSNSNPAFTRVRLRQEIESGRGGIDAARLAGMARRWGRARAATEAETARLLARHAALHPAGFAWLDPGLFGAPLLKDRLLDDRAQPAMAALAAALITIGGGADYPPRRERLERLYEAVAENCGKPGGGWTLGGCLILPRRGKLLLCREPSAVAAPIRVLPGERLLWDQRFLMDAAPSLPSGLWLGALGRDAASIRRAVKERHKESHISAIPAVCWPSLPSLRDAKGVVAVPTLGYFDRVWMGASTAACRVVFRPNRPLSGARFTFV